MRGLEDQAGEEGSDCRDRGNERSEEGQALISVRGLVSFRLLHAARRRSAASLARKAAAAMTRLIWRCQPCQVKWPRLRALLFRYRDRRHRHGLLVRPLRSGTGDTARHDHDRRRACRLDRLAVAAVPCLRRDDGIARLRDRLRSVVHQRDALVRAPARPGGRPGRGWGEHRRHDLAAGDLPRSPAPLWAMPCWPNWTGWRLEGSSLPKPHCRGPADRQDRATPAGTQRSSISAPWPAASASRRSRVTSGASNASARAT